ncbi:14129_t:CDS:2, partial [Dentiscutata heterogama]
MSHAGEEIANSVNRTAVCKYCVDYYGYLQALLTSKVTNVVNSCLAHLYKCSYFANKFSDEEITLSNKILEEVTKKIIQAQITIAQQDLQGIIIAFDRWKNIVKQKLI